MAEEEKIPQGVFFRPRGVSPTPFDSLRDVYEVEYPETLQRLFPLSTSAKIPLSRLGPDERVLRYRDERQMLLFLQSQSPEDITPELLLMAGEFLKDGIINYASAQDGKVLQIATSTVQVSEVSHKYVEEDKKGRSLLPWRRK